MIIKNITICPHQTNIPLGSQLTLVGVPILATGETLVTEEADTATDPALVIVIDLKGAAEAAEFAAATAAATTLLVIAA